MDSLLPKSAVAVLAAAAAFAGATGAADAAKVRGTVVHHNRHAHSFVVAGRGGRLFAVHARRSPCIGRHVVVTARRLRNGTFRLQRLRATGRISHRVRARGVISWVNRRKGEFTLSAPGVSMLVRTRHSSAAGAAAAMPRVGTDVVVSGRVDDEGDLEEQDVQDEGMQTTGITLEGQVLSIDTTARTITVSADDEDESGGTVVVDVPATLDITQFTVGEDVELLVQPNSDGTVTLLGSSDDENAQTAEDQGDQQGDDPGDEGGSDDQTGSGDQTSGSSGSDGGSMSSSGSTSGGDK